ncbi:MAG TPA: hypothetical protein VEU08_09970 [Vicinamibacterales bacterium]|nr:hypothetical protein [Vicinamibacterales bacterium]
MNDPLFVCGFEGFSDLLRDSQGFVDRQRASRDAIRQRRSLDQLHDECWRTGGILEAMDVRDVGMIQRREEPGLPLEPREAFAITCDGTGQDFDRDVTIELRVAGAVDLTHAARTERRQDFINAEACASCERHVSETRELYRQGHAVRGESRHRWAQTCNAARTSYAIGRVRSSARRSQRNPHERSAHGRSTGRRSNNEGRTIDPALFSPSRELRALPQYNRPQR